MQEPGLVVRKDGNAHPIGLSGQHPNRRTNSAFMSASLHSTPGPPKTVGVGDRLALIQGWCLSAGEKPGVGKRQRRLSLYQLKTVPP